jgi:hypothetical protein
VSAEPTELRLQVTAGFGAVSRVPFVQVEVPTALVGAVFRRGPSGPVPDENMVCVQLTPDEARGLALNLLEAAEAALGDGFLLTFLEREAGMPVEQLMPLLRKFRGYRTQQSKEGG